MAFFRKHKAPVKEFFFCSPGVALLLSTRTWTCMGWIPLQQRFRVARPPLSFRPNGQDVSAFTEDNRDLRRQTRKAEDICAIRGCWSKRRWGTNPRHLFRYCEATLHVRDFRRIAAVAEAVVRCMWPEKAQAIMKELFDDGFQHPGRSTLLRARIRLDITSMLENDGSIAIVGIRSLGGGSISKLTPLRSLAESFLVWFGIWTVAAHPGSCR